MKLIYWKVSALIMIIGFSCKKDTMPLDALFKDLNKTIESEKFLAFKEANKDSVTVYFQKFTKDFYEIYGDSSHYIGVGNFMDSIGIGKYHEIRVLFLAFAYHSRLNNEKNGIEKVKKDMQNFLERMKERKFAEKEVYDKETLQSNDKNWKQGDTLDIILPTRVRNSGIKSTYYAAPYPWTLDFPPADDTLKIKGKLVEKYYHKYSATEPVDSMELFFKLRLLEISDTTVHILMKEYDVGDTFDLDLESYGRPIK